MPLNSAQLAALVERARQRVPPPQPIPPPRPVPRQTPPAPRAKAGTLLPKPRNTVPAPAVSPPPPTPAPEPEPAARDALRRRVSTTGSFGSGCQPAMIRAHSRACWLSPTPGNGRRSSTAAANSPRWWKISRIAAASASVTENMHGAWPCAPWKTTKCRLPRSPQYARLLGGGFSALQARQRAPRIAIATRAAGGTFPRKLNPRPRSMRCRCFNRLPPSLPVISGA